MYGSSLRFARIDPQVHANRLILANRFRVPELNPFFGNGQVSLIFGVPNFCAFSLLVLCLFKVQVEAKKRKN